MSKYTRKTRRVRTISTDDRLALLFLWQFCFHVLHPSYCLSSFAISASFRTALLDNFFVSSRDALRAPGHPSPHRPAHPTSHRLTEYRDAAAVFQGQSVHRRPRFAFHCASSRKRHQDARDGRRANSAIEGEFRTLHRDRSRWTPSGCRNPHAVLAPRNYSLAFRLIRCDVVACTLHSDLPRRLQLRVGP